MNWLFELLFCPVHGIFRAVTFEQIRYGWNWLCHYRHYVAAWLLSRKEIVK